MPHNTKRHYITFLKYKAKLHCIVIEKVNNKYVERKIYITNIGDSSYFSIFRKNYKPTFLEKIKIFFDYFIIYYEDV